MYTRVLEIPLVYTENRWVLVLTFDSLLVQCYVVVLKLCFLCILSKQSASPRRGKYVSTFR
jgi:hypothetical protein